MGVGSLVVALGSIGGLGTHTSITLFFPTLNIEHILTLCDHEIATKQHCHTDSFRLHEKKQENWNFICKCKHYRR